ncbi:7494_t:CDS:2 [Paraglomus occultum]|uniref:7494_t:CDS:1 n=1 Tax=Paraglomus occultum TaxID=144539 RepID=A0A9N9B2M3_9GLOM|nr:7494_t:CDS:2 [Paraglomus occultum]
MNSEVLAPGEKVELPSLTDHIDPRDFGSRVVHTKPLRRIPRSSSPADLISPHPAPEPSRIPLAVPSDSTDRSRIIFSTHSSSVYRETYDLLLSLINNKIIGGDMPQEVIIEFAENVLEIARHNEWSDRKKKEAIEKLLPEEEDMGSDLFEELIGAAEAIIEFPQVVEERKIGEIEARSGRNVEFPTMSDDNTVIESYPANGPFMNASEIEDESEFKFSTEYDDSITPYSTDEDRQ